METVDLEAVLADAFIARHPEEVSRRLERSPAAENSALLAATEVRAAARVLERMAPLDLGACLSAMSAEQVGPLLGHMDLDAAAGALRRVAGAAREAMLAEAPGGTSDRLRRLLAYPPGTAGALMEPRVWSAAEDQAIGEILAAARREPPELATYVYGVDREQRLVGVAGLAELIRVDPKTPLEAVLGRDVARVRATLGGDELLEHPAWTEHRVLPVVDDVGRLLGAVRQRSMRKVLAPTASETRLPASAFGELYWIGITGMLSGLVAAFGGPSTAESSENES